MQLEEFLNSLEQAEAMNGLERFIQYLSLNKSYVWEQFSTHFLISIYGVFFAAIIAIPVGFYIAKHKKLANWVIGLANIMQTIPSLATISMLMLAFGLGARTVILTVFLYSLLPIIKNTYEIGRAHV